MLVVVADVELAADELQKWRLDASGRSQLRRYRTFHPVAVNDDACSGLDMTDRVSHVQLYLKASSQPLLTIFH